MHFNKHLLCTNCSLSSSVFKHLEPHELEIIENNRIEVYYKPGETIFKSGTPMTHILSFNSGLAKISLDSSEGKTLILDFVRPHAFFSGPGLLTDNKHHFTITAIEKCGLCLINIEPFLEIMKHNPAMSISFIENSNNFMINLMNKIESLFIKRQHGRIAETLLFLKKELYKCNPFKLTFSTSIISEISGVSKESTSRILHEFINDGILKIDGKSFQILNEELLSQINVNG